ncbi:zinc ribbon domain-containing protein [Herpetosiphon llansteffanensis]|uniref:zinc ribbon domain-containing protein n=1 Tax=Herpetosiphon llansteffanensis TaxID=2094568 RepID=UPI000D7C626C|nr:zinc ribbon domain-containing protein [Herpetosiphon llansteffanensis]
MDCSACGRHNETAAVFCIYCGFRLETVNQHKPVQAAIGKTIDLRRESAPAVQSIPVIPKLEPVVPPMAAAQPIAPVALPRKQSNDGLMLIGIVLLALVFFSKLAIPTWMLFMMGFGVLSLRKSRQTAVWMIGIPILMLTGWWWAIVFLIMFSNNKSKGCGMKHSYKH